MSSLISAELSLHGRRNWPYNSRSLLALPSSPKPPNESGQADQVLKPKTRPASRHNSESVFSDHARPTGRQRSQMSALVAEVDAVLTPIVAVNHEVELLSEPWMEGMRDSDRPGRLRRARCSRLRGPRSGVAAPPRTCEA